MSAHTIHAYCDQQGLSFGMFYYWKRKLKSSFGPPTFTELQIIEPAQHRAAIHIRFPSGVEIWLEGHMDPAFLKVLAGC